MRISDWSSDVCSSDLKLDAAELARTTRLLFVGIVDLDFLREGPSVGHLRRANIGLYLEFTAHAIDQDFQVKLTHALDDSLARFMVRADAEAWNLCRKTIERNAHFLLVSPGIGLYRHSNAWVGYSNVVKRRGR